MYTPLRCTSILLGVFLFREKISLLNGSISSPSPCLYSQSGLGRKWKTVPTILLFGHFPLPIFRCFFLGGGMIVLSVPTGRFRDSIKTHKFEGFCPFDNSVL